MEKEHKAELKRLAAVHKREMDDILQQAVEAHKEKDMEKERLEQELSNARWTS